MIRFDWSMEIVSRRMRRWVRTWEFWLGYLVLLDFALALRVIFGDCICP